MHLQSGRYFSLNETGTAVWDRIGEEATLDELLRHLVEGFAVKPDEAWDDLVALMRDLESEGLVVVQTRD